MRDIVGLDGPLDEHIVSFAKHGVEQVMMAFRRSPEGDRTAEKVASRLKSPGSSASASCPRRAWTRTTSCSIAGRIRVLAAPSGIARQGQGEGGGDRGAGGDGDDHADDQ